MVLVFVGESACSWCGGTGVAPNSFTSFTTKCIHCEGKGKVIIAPTSYNYAHNTKEQQK